MDPRSIDDLQPASLQVTLGEAIREFETSVDAAGTWASVTIRDKALTDAEVVAAFAEWDVATKRMLQRVFVSEAPLLRFWISRPEGSVDSRRGNAENLFNRRCHALLDERLRLLDMRERIAVAANALAERLVRHAELLSELRQTRAMTDDLWQRLVAKPDLAPPIARLGTLGVGVGQNAIWDVIKLLGVFLAS